jgi:hypothetical protein
VNRRNLPETFPITLFGFLWLLSIAFILILMSFVHNVLAGEKIKVISSGFLIRSVLLIGIASMWIGIILDQMPCFLGVPNCD